MYFNNKDCYQSFLGSISLRQIYQELITNAIEIDNTRRKYKKYTDQQRFQIEKYATENGTAALAQKYGPKFPQINKSTIKEFKKKHEVALRRSKNSARQETVKGLTAEKGDCPLVPGKVDGMVQTYIRSVSNRGGVVMRSMAVATTKALMIHYPDMVGKIDLDNLECAKAYSGE